MERPRLKIGLRGRVILIIGIGLLWVVARYQASRMDERFFQPSVSGVTGLIYYMVGHYSGSGRRASEGLDPTGS